MKLEKATYSYSAVRDCIDAAKNVNETVSKKAEHFAKWMEMQKLLDLCYNKTGCVLFERDWPQEYEIYTKMQNNPKQYTKKEMDRAAHCLLRYIKNQLVDIYNMMERGEVNATL